VRQETTRTLYSSARSEGFNLDSWQIICSLGSRGSDWPRLSTRWETTSATSARALALHQFVDVVEHGLERHESTG
jgi:hypothetical protein